MKLRILAANILLALHIVIGAIIFFGWLWPAIRPLYLALLIAWPVSWLLCDCCILSKWEYQLRGIYTPAKDLNGVIMSDHYYRAFKIRIPPRFIFAAGAVALVISMVGNALYTIRTGLL